MRVTMQKPATFLVVCLSIIMLIVPATSTATAQESATSSTDFSSLIRGDRLMTVPGTTVVLDPATGDIVDVIFPSKAQTTKVAPTRGCTDTNAGCWAGGTAFGDLQFAKIGYYEGPWASRNAYYTGNRWGRVSWKYAGKVHKSLVMGEHSKITMAGGAAVTGLWVDRR